ncbi:MULTISPECIES: hypothetical protein [unclassified Variovorax]|uniref:hypothetical protein n=1 Tax=unclassified Variovorax TaxID=663243 RepID=UPI00076DA533|nr:MULTISPECIES: hypothetical protein [unclassified Variovorax]KWT98040.1 hypothetical protein APY03_0711 [Variovorax sp. WDL1]
MQLQGTDPFHERRLREKAAEGRPDAAVQPRHALAPIRASTGRQGELACFGRLAFERMQEVSPPFGKPLTWNDISDRTREVWADVAGTIAAAAVAANKTKREDRECRAN